MDEDVYETVPGDELSNITAGTPMASGGGTVGLRQMEGNNSQRLIRTLPVKPKYFIYLRIPLPQPPCMQWGMVVSRSSYTVYDNSIVEGNNCVPQ
jgi:hypothetical protein